MTNPARIFNPTQYVMGLGIRLTGALSKGWLMGGRGRGHPGASLSTAPL